MSFEKVYYKGKEMKRDTKARTKEIRIEKVAIGWIIGPAKSYSELMKMIKAQK